MVSDQLIDLLKDNSITIRFPKGGTLFEARGVVALLSVPLLFGLVMVGMFVA